MTPRMTLVEQLWAARRAGDALLARKISEKIRALDAEGFPGTKPKKAKQKSASKKGHKGNKKKPSKGRKHEDAPSVAPGSYAKAVGLKLKSKAKRARSVTADVAEISAFVDEQDEAAKIRAVVAGTHEEDCEADPKVAGRLKRAAIKAAMAAVGSKEANPAEADVDEILRVTGENRYGREHLEVAREAAKRMARRAA